MRRTRYKNLSSEDSQIRDRVDRACSELEEAIRVARQIPGGGAARTLRELSSLHRGLQDVGRANPVSTDPDLLPESERNKRYRDKLREERRAKRQEKEVGNNV